MTNIVYLGASLDGFIADKEGRLDFLDSAGDPPTGEDYGYEKFMGSIDALVMGRNSYDTVMGFDVAWPYGDKTVLILTNRDIEIADDIKDNVSSFSGTPSEVVDHLKTMGKENLYIDGGKVVQDFLREGLIDEMIITIIPVLIGAGIPLFGHLDGQIKLNTERATHFDNGVVQLNYKIAK